MSCSVAVSNSPVFSPSPRLFSISPSPLETLTLTHFKSSHSPSSSSPSSSSSSSSPCSPFRLRLPKASSSSTVLKRKRPATLVIPTVDVPVCAPLTPGEIEREGFGFSVYSKRGRREAIEDRFSADVHIQAHPNQAFFGVFDGHGGAKAAEFAAEKLGNNILDEVLRSAEEDIEDAVKHGYLTTDADFLKEDIDGGSCSVTALIRGGKLVVSNAGDCRAVMSRGGLAEVLTFDHRPSREDEKQRIENTGGYVDLIRGVWRVQGSLAVSRGIGDRHLKKWVIAEPETKIISITPECEFLILASDGLWDKVGNQEAVDIARSFCLGVEKPEVLSACKRLVDLSVSRGSADDVSVMLVQLGHYI